MVSVVIPTFNRSRLLERAIDSVRRQRYQDWELIVVEDGSDPQYRPDPHHFHDRRIHYVYQRHQGVSAARNTGIRLARFPWIAFLDSDDHWQPRKLERQIEALEENLEYRAACTNEIWMRRGRRVNPRKIHRKYGGWIYHRCLPLCIISPSSALLHRSVLEETGLFDESFPVCEDYEMWLRIACRRPILFLPEPLVVKTGGHADQLSRSRWGLDRYRVRALIKIYRSGRLTPQQTIWTAQEIVRKAMVLAKGFGNRGKAKEARRYRNMARQWTKG